MMPSQSEVNQEKTKQHIEDSPMTPFLARIAAFTLGGMLTDGYMLGHIGIALAMATPELALDGLWLGLLAASTLIGILIGAPIAGRLADRFGRRRLLAWDFAVIGIVAVAHLFVSDVAVLVALRTIMGVAIGAEYAIGAAVLSEFAPRRNRGTLLASLNAAWIVGFVAGFISAYAMRSAGVGWRVVFASAAIPAVMVFLLRLGTPESPRWLVSKGRHREALEIVNRFYGSSFGIAGLAPETTSAKGVPSGVRTLFSPAYRTRTVFAGGFWACQVMPLFALTIFLPQVFEALGIESEFGAEMLVNGMLLVGAITGIVAIKYLPRRFFIISTFAFVALMLVIMSFSGGLPFGISITAFASFVLVASAASNLEYVYPSEIFPTEIRATGMGFAAAISRVGAALSTFFLPVALERMGNGPTMLLLAAVAALGLVMSICWAPETKGKSLAEAASTEMKI